MISDSKVYTEISELLSFMNIDEVNRIPESVRNYIEEEKAENYITRIDKEEPFNPNNIDQRTINLITWLNIKYIANEEEKDVIIKMCENNDEINKQKYNVDVFDDNAVNKEENNNSSIDNLKDDNVTDIKENNQLIEVRKDNPFTKLFKMIKSLFVKKK